MGRPIVKYLDPVSGNYEYATIVDVGDLSKLNTRLKGTLVDAINSILEDGFVGGGGEEVPQFVIDQINNIRNTIDSLKDGTFEIVEWGSVNDYYNNKFEAIVEDINQYNREQIDYTLIEAQKIADEAMARYTQKVSDSEARFDQATQTLDSATQTLSSKAQELEMANINYDELTTVVDEIDNYIETNIKSIDFDNFNAMTSDYQTLVTQTAEEFGLEASEATLSYLSGRVTDAHARLSVQANLISSKVSYDEFQYIPLQEFDYAENYLKHTMDFSKDWTRDNTASFISNEVLFHGKVVQFDDNSGNIWSNSDDLVVGETYTISVYVNTQSNSNPNYTDKFSPTNRSYNPDELNIRVGTQSLSEKVYEDLSGINGWFRVYATFVAESKNTKVEFSFDGLDFNQYTGYLALPKLEKDVKVTPWQPHTEDEYATLLSQKSIIRQYGDKVESYSRQTQQLEESFIESTSSFEQMAEGFRLNTEAVEQFSQDVEGYEESVRLYGSEVALLNESISLKVWEDDFKEMVQDINIDNRNRVLNSDFIRNNIDPNTRRLVVENWTLQDGWGLKFIGDAIFLNRKRTSVANVSTSTATSDYFMARTSERIMFSFDLEYSGLDNDAIFALELFDVNNNRLLKKDFNLIDLTETIKDGYNRYSGYYNISTNGVQKARAVLQLPKNGDVSFSKVSVQNGSIGQTDWMPAPEDSWIIQSKLQSEIQVNKDAINLITEDERIDALTGMLIKRDGKYTVSPEAIISEVTRSELGEDALVTGTQFKQTADGWEQRLVSKDGIIQDINASEEELKIGFNKVRVEGHLLADILSTEALDVTRGFRLTDGTNTILYADSEGKVKMNVSSLEIGGLKPATTKDIEQIELTPGPQGERGNDGDDGVGISSIKEFYLTTDKRTNVVRTVGDWGENYIPISEDKPYVWSYTRTVYTNNDVDYTIPIMIGHYGKDGSQGPQGVPGKKGLDGKTTYTWIQYADDIDGNGMSNSPIDKEYIGIATNKLDPVESEDQTQYVWTKFVGQDGSHGTDGDDGVTTYTWIRYSENSSGSPMTVTPNDKTKYIGIAVNKTSPTPTQDASDYTWSKFIGEDGKDGVSITGVEERYKLSKLRVGETHGGSWDDTPKTPTDELPYLWNYEIITYSEGSPTITTPSVIGMYSADGTSITKVEELYALSTTPTQPSDAEFSTGIKVTNSIDKYLWNKEIITLKHDNGSLETQVHYAIIGTHGEKGDDGVSITSVEEKYKLSSLREGETTSGIWVNTPEVPNRSKPYLWNYEIIRYSQGSPTITEPKVISMYSADGSSISNIEELYALSSTTTQPSDDKFTPEMKVTTSLNKYLWNKEIVTIKHDDGSLEPHVSYRIIGAHGESGKDGKDGRGISRTEIRYANHTNGTTAPTSGWSQDIPDPVKGKYQWTRTYVEYTEGDPTTSYNVSYIPLDGQRGNSGNGVVGSNITYAQTDTNVKPSASSWAETMPTPTPGKYLWTRTVISYTDGSTSEAISVAYQAIDGYTPVKGKDYFDGKDGVSITSVVERYKLSTLAEGETTSGTWDSTPKTPTRQLPYLWNYEIINYSEGNPTVTEPAVIGMYSADGTSIVNVEEFYALSTTTTRPAENSFTKTMKVTDEVNKYLWNKEVITLRHDDGTTTPESSYAIIGVHGKAGSDGVGISSTVIEYSVSSSGTTVPTSGWGRTVPTTNPGQYLWTRTTWTYTNNDVEHAYSVAYEGRNGPKGDDGVGVASTIIDYTASTSGTAVPTGGWNTKIPTVPIGSFLWTRTRWTYTNGDVETGYSVSRAAKDGVSIVSVVEKYKLSTLLEGETTAGVWDNTPKAPTRELPYLWNYEIINYSSGSPTVTTPAVIGMYSADGTSIVNVEELYALSNTTTQPSDNSFTPGIKVTSETNKYLWNKEIITLKHDDGRTETKAHYAIIGTHGTRGYTPVKNVDYFDGVGIDETTIHYAVSSSGTVVPASGWLEDIPKVDPGKYLWTRTRWVYTDTRTELAYSVAYEGKNGPKGDDGVGIASSLVQYARSTSGTVEPSASEWGTTIPTPVKGEYLWTKTSIIYTDGDTSVAYSTSYYAKDGKDGENANARNYLLRSKPSEAISNSIYNIAKFDLAEAPVVGETYTYAMKASLSSGKTWFRIYNSGGSVNLGTLIRNGDYYYITFSWKSGGDSHISVYAGPDGGTGVSTIEWATLVKGSVPMLEWVPAHEDIQGDVQGVRERMSEAESALSQMTGTIEDISGNISELSAANYMTSSEYHDSLRQELESFEANINLGPIRTTTDIIDQNFTFSDLGMVVGSDSQKSKVRVANDRIEMINENKVASYIVGGTMFADNFVALQGITLLNHTVTSENNKTVFRYQESE